MILFRVYITLIEYYCTTHNQVSCFKDLAWIYGNHKILYMHPISPNFFNSPMTTLIALILPVPKLPSKVDLDLMSLHT